MHRTKLRSPVAGNAGARQTSQKHPQLHIPEVVQHLPHLRLETWKDLLGQLSIQKPELPWRSHPSCNLQEDQPPASSPAIFFHQLAPEPLTLLPSLGARELGARRDWDTEMVKTSLSPGFFRREECGVTVCMPQRASSSSFASDTFETELKRGHFSIPCPPGAQQLHLHVPKEGFHRGMLCQSSLPKCSPGVMLGGRNQCVGVSQTAKGSTESQLEFKRATLLPSRQNISLAKPPNPPNFLIALCLQDV